MAIKNLDLDTTATYVFDSVTGAPSNTAITTIIVCNNSATVPAMFDLHFVEQGVPYDNDKTRVINNLELEPKETFSFDSERVVLSQGDNIYFMADVVNPGDTPNLSATISYLEV